MNTFEHALHLKVVVKTASEKVEGVELLPNESGFSWEIVGPATPQLIYIIETFLKAYANKKEAPLPPVDWRKASPFTRKVAKGLTSIPFGEIASYQELATAIASPKYTRAVGSALGRNPFPLLYPCHRIVSANGLGGFSCGLPLKKTLLQHEIG
ncbi:MAG: Bifunctional transcriptional activator/DNA repair enzyme Ada [Chlamydiae bacterium]|nr:Bifunctional transcriptional activator/DNA repair enzyme Ada [Chlamydiota bacterium]